MTDMQHSERAAIELIDAASIVLSSQTLVPIKNPDGILTQYPSIAKITLDLLTERLMEYRKNMEGTDDNLWKLTDKINTLCAFARPHSVPGMHQLMLLDPHSLKALELAIVPHYMHAATTCPKADDLYGTYSFELLPFYAVASGRTQHRYRRVAIPPLKWEAQAAQYALRKMPFYAWHKFQKLISADPLQSNLNNLYRY